MPVLIVDATIEDAATCDRGGWVNGCVGWGGYIAVVGCLKAPGQLGSMENGRLGSQVMICRTSEAHRDVCEAEFSGENTYWQGTK